MERHEGRVDRVVEALVLEAPKGVRVGSAGVDRHTLRRSQP